ncbi:GAF domain-containing protein [Nocardia australiensis]|uniref:GAF domain-containing protein n=1 Tax=Nocardia australiensis TaxID=2887191 RepID=UPI001D151CF8|nr:GAF domain-containing protein [Nocardia australiensis]
MPEHDWLLVETLAGHGAPTLVADGDRMKDWSSLRRVRRELPAAASRRIAEVVQRCTVSAHLETDIDDKLRVVGVPIGCAYGGVHGVQVWAGPPARVPGPPPAVAAWDWDAETELAHHGPGLEELVFARAPEEVRVIRTPPEAFGRMVRFDGRIEYFALVGAGEGQYQGDVDMIGDDGRVRTFQMVTRARPSIRRISALMHQLTDTALMRPDVEMTMMRAVSRRADEGIGFVELNSGVIYEWPRTPPPPLNRWATERPVFHPDDVAAFRSVLLELAGAADRPARQLRIRVRFADTGWIPVLIDVMPLMSQESGHGLLVVREPAD